MEFGAPQLEIREPVESTSDSKRARTLLARRRVHVQGQWHFWIYCCDWSIFDEMGELVGGTTSKRAIDRAARYLDGQALISGSLVTRGMRTILTFDLGATLVTKPYNRTDEQWMLYEPEGNVLTIRADKRYSYGLGNRAEGEKSWRPIGVRDAQLVRAKNSPTNRSTRSRVKRAPG
jgi:hypothetical protein